MIATIAIAVAIGLIANPAASGQPVAAVINEIHYHPPCAVTYTPCDDAPAEFIEIANASGAPLDISGWQLVDGVDFTFAPGTMIAADGFVVVAENIPGFLAGLPAAPVVPIGEWAGQLSNSGERIALVDHLGAPVDEVAYSDGSTTPGAWSVTTDGDGNSLQRLTAGNPDGASYWWAAASPTPGSVNANGPGAPPAVITDLSWTVLPQEHQDTIVDATIIGADNATLEYRIGFPGTTQSVLMTQVGSAFHAAIPATEYGPGDLIRFRIQSAGAIIAPTADNTIDWLGTTAADPSVASNLPVIEWFTSQENYDAGFDEQGDALHDGVLAHNGVVYDNVGFRIRGNIARTDEWSKRNWKFVLPDHHRFEIDGLSYDVDTFDLQGGFADESRVREVVGYQIAREMGIVAPEVMHVRVQLNGEYFGLHTLQEHPEGGFMANNGLENATLFRTVHGDHEAGPPTATADTTVGYETWDIPEYINLLAAATVIQHNDFAHTNFYWWYDHDEHQRFEGMLWDLDLSQGIRYPPDAALTTVLENGTNHRYLWGRWKSQAPVFEQVLGRPWRELYLRRVRTLADEWYATGRYEALARATFAALGSEWALDTAAWGFWGSGSYSAHGAIDRYADTWIDQFSAHLDAGGPDLDLPSAQPAEPTLTLLVDHSPADPAAEHIKIMNHESVAIDISGWQITGSTSAVLPPGSVLPAGGAAHVVGDDTITGFRAVTTDLYVLGEYVGALPDAGGEVSLADPAGAVHATEAWGAGAAPVGIVLNEWNAVGAGQTLPNGDTRLGSVTGNGGDWFELVVVEDNLDARGWTIDIFEAGALATTLALSDDPLWSELRAGTIITIAEQAPIGADGGSWPEDPSYWPAAGDWWIHVVAGAGGTGRYVSPLDFPVSNRDWQVAIRDESGMRRFGPAGEGVGALVTGGVNSSEVGELEADPSPATTPSWAYSDGDQSTFGDANGYAGVVQNLAAIRPVLDYPGDVNCSGAQNVVDALSLAQYAAGLRTATASCPLSSPATELNISAGDVDRSGTVNVIDALIVAQCAADIANPHCVPAS